jgi:hypothetical protein
MHCLLSSGALRDFPLPKRHHQQLPVRTAGRFYRGQSENVKKKDSLAPLDSAIPAA